MLRKRGHRVVCSRIQTVDSRTIWVVCSCRKVKLHYLQAQQLGKPGLTGCTVDFPDKGFLCEVSRAWFPSCCHPMETHQASHFLHPVRLLNGNGSHSVLRWLSYASRVLGSEGWRDAWQLPRETLVGKDRAWRPQVSFGWASPWNVILYPSVRWHCWLGDRKGIRPVKSCVLVCDDDSTGVCASYSSSCHHRLRHP